MELTQKEIRIICNALYKEAQKVKLDADYYYNDAEYLAYEEIRKYEDVIRDLYLRMCAEIEEE